MWSLQSNTAAAALRPVGASWPVLAGSGASGPGHGSLLARGAPGWPSQAPDRAGGRQGRLGHTVPRQLLFLLIWSSVWGSAGLQPSSLCLGGKEASQSPHHPSLSSLTPAPVVMPPRRGVLYWSASGVALTDGETEAKRGRVSGDSSPDPQRQAAPFPGSVCPPSRALNWVPRTHWSIGQGGVRASCLCPTPRAQLPAENS